jgi:hypothetical protein
MATNLPTYPRFLALFLHIRLLNLTSRFPRLPGGVLDEQTTLLRKAQVLPGEIHLEQISPALARQEKSRRGTTCPVRMRPIRSSYFCTAEDG